ncbi:hypothetical protein MC119_003967 [Salmonella enterica]|nr:hypothetical protein [Salmonella enterica]EIW4258194.1 hypothetical protein [Salmonella enterica]
MQRRLKRRNAGLSCGEVRGFRFAHVDKNAIRGTYNHALYLEGRREMMQWYADYIDKIGRVALRSAS